MSVYLLATLDTKGNEAAFVRDQLRDMGVDALVVDTGCIDGPLFAADIPREEVFRKAGAELSDVVKQHDRGQAIALASAGVAELMVEAHAQGKVDGIIALGGSAGTTIGTSAMRALPLGVPKLMVSTLASGQVKQYVGTKDILMLNSVVDIAGLNRISCMILHQAAAALAGMVLQQSDVQTKEKPLVAATMFGVTTRCVDRAREILETAGFEVLVFHATGNGGLAMESLIDDGMIAGVLDITTTELADELVGGVLSAGPDRLTAAGRRAVPQVVSVGATDMVNFNSPDSIPPQFKDRKFYRHNPSVTLMRTTPKENTELGTQIARKVGQTTGPAVIMIPMKGVSAIDNVDQPFDDPIARHQLFDAIRQHHGHIPLIELNYHINDPEFAEAVANQLIELIRHG